MIQKVQRNCISILVIVLSILAMTGIALAQDVKDAPKNDIGKVITVEATGMTYAVIEDSEEANAKVVLTAVREIHGEEDAAYGYFVIPATINDGEALCDVVGIQPGAFDGITTLRGVVLSDAIHDLAEGIFTLKPSTSVAPSPSVLPSVTALEQPETPLNTSVLSTQDIQGEGATEAVVTPTADAKAEPSVSLEPATSVAPEGDDAQKSEDAVFTIYCNENSDAQAYAKENQIACVTDAMTIAPEADEMAKDATQALKVDTTLTFLDLSQVVLTTTDDTVLGINEDGTITAKKVGSATIAAEVSGLKATTEITVNAPVETPLVSQEAIQAQVQAKIAAQAVEPTNVGLSYKVHGQNYGWQSARTAGSAGVTGQSLRMEAMTVALTGKDLGNSSILYRAHVQNIGWQGWSSNGALTGTTGQSKRMESVEIKLSGTISDYYDVYYRVHVQNYGWLSWAKNGQTAGTTGLGYRAEAVQIRLVKKGSAAPGDTGRPCVTRAMVQSQTSVVYTGHVQNIGWQGWRANGATIGTSGRALRVEAIRAQLSGLIAGSSISYNAHVQDIGWQGWRANGQMAGTTGQSKRVEGIQIKLTGTAASLFDVYYQVHIQNYGWMGWAKNGESAGSSGGSLRMEAINIRLVPKGGAAPGSTARPFVAITPKPQWAPPSPTCLYVDVDAQTLRYYSNNQLVVSTPVVTGLAGVYDTPRGDFSIYDTDQNIFLRGPGYSSFVRYWMPFYSDYGIHDADGWRSTYGGDTYLYDGSHGCVNTPGSAMDVIFANAGVGTPVYVR